ncbi:MAG: FkbM family methyltransferase [Acidobacteria bacterium]|nr:FkbM family methyltransferase [Acidobacteriota bacterium]
MFLKLAKRVIEEVSRRHFLRLVEDAYDHPNQASHMRVRTAARSWYGISRNTFLERASSQLFIELVYQAQLELFRGGSDLDLGASPIGYENLVLHCRSSDANSSAVYLYGFSDNLTYFTLYRDHVRPGSVAMDVGANLGIHSLVLARCAGDRGTVLAYEPSNAIHDRLLRNIEGNGASNIVPRKLGLWEKSGSAGFEPRARDFNIGKGQIRQDSLLQIQVRTVDEEAEGLDRHIDLIKIDVEGCELSVLKGASKTLSEHKPVLIIEFNPKRYSFRDFALHIPYDARYYRVPCTLWKSLTSIENLDFDERADLLIVPSDTTPRESTRGVLQ